MSSRVLFVVVGDGLLRLTALWLIVRVLPVDVGVVIFVGAYVLAVGGCADCGGTVAGAATLVVISPLVLIVAALAGVVRAVGTLVNDGFGFSASIVGYGGGDVLDAAVG